MAKRLALGQYMTQHKPELDSSDPKACREHLEIVDAPERLMAVIDAEQSRILAEREIEAVGKVPIRHLR